MGLALGFLLRSLISHCLSIISDFPRAIKCFTCWEGSLLYLLLISLTHSFLLLFLFCSCHLYACKYGRIAFAEQAQCR